MINAQLAPFGAVGDGVADDTAALQAAVDYATCTNGAPSIIWVPPGYYKLSSALQLRQNNHLEIYGAGTMSGFYAVRSRTVLLQTTPAANGIQFIGSPAAANMTRFSLHDLAIVGGTNGFSGAGVWLGQTFQADYGCVQGVTIKNVDVSGFANGIEAHDVVTMVCESVHSMYNTHRAFKLNRADSCDLDNCWGGSDPPGIPNLQQIAIEDTGNVPDGSMAGLGVTVRGGEWGNCYGFLQADACTLSILGGNRESFYTTNGICTFINNCQYTEVGVRWASLTNIGAPIWRVFNSVDGKYNSSIQIYNPTLPYQYSMSVEGLPFTDMPVFQAVNYLGWTNMVYRSTIGGAITHGYPGNSTPDKNQGGFWTANQTFAGPFPLRLQSGFENGGGAALEMGGDMDANTLTANTTKFAEIVFPPYASTSYNVGGLMHLGDVSGNYLDIGSAFSQAGENFIRFWTASNPGANATVQWYIDNNGLLASAGGGFSTLLTYLPTNAMSAWPAVAPAAGTCLMMNSNGVIYMLCSKPGSTAWTRTNLVAQP